MGQALLSAVTERPRACLRPSFDIVLFFFSVYPGSVIPVAVCLAPSSAPGLYSENDMVRASVA